MNEQKMNLKNDAELEEVVKYASSIGIFFDGDAVKEEELSENELEIVAGGMSDATATVVLLRTAYELKVYGRNKTYSKATIQEAMRHTGSIVNKCNAAITICKTLLSYC